MRNSILTKPSHKMRDVPPVRLIVCSFLGLILLGTFLLTLPVSGRSGWTDPLTALFTATSCTCVTGLSVVDTTTHWSLFGQAVMLGLIQLGGLGLSTFAVAFTVLIRRKMGIRARLLASESSGGENMDALSLLRWMLGFTFVCELTGALLLLLRLYPRYGTDAIWPSVFVAVSAYCNAGFDIWGFVPGNTSSLVAFAEDPLVSLTVSFLVIFGGLGFVVVRDLFTRKKGEMLRFHTKICLGMTALLLLFGTVLFFWMEYDGVLSEMSFAGKWIASFFQSANARTAGFASVDIAAERDMTKVLSSVLMMIGGCPGSTAGGLKVTTLVVILVTVGSTLRGQVEPSVLRHRFSSALVNKAVTIAVLGILVLFVDSALLSALNPQLAFIDCLYEAASAFGTAGLTANVTTRLEPISRLLLCLTMFIGRVGPLSFGLSILLRPRRGGELVLPEASLLIG